MKNLILVLTCFTLFSFGISQDNENAFAWFLEKEDVRPSPVSYFSKEIRSLGPDGVWADVWGETREYTFNQDKELIKGVFYPSYETKLDKTEYTFDTHGNLLEKSKYSNGKIFESESYSFTPTNKLSCKIYFGIGSGYQYEKYSYNSNDLLTTKSFYSNEFTSTNLSRPKYTCDTINDAELIHKSSYHYTNGKKTSVIWVNFFNNSKSSINYSYTKEGNLATEEYFDENSILVSKRTHTYTNSGNLIETHYTSFQANSPDENSSTRYAYFKNGQFKSIQSFDAKGKSIFNTEFDIDGNLTKDSIYHFTTASSRYRDGILIYDLQKGSDFFTISSFGDSSPYEGKYTYNHNGDLLEEQTTFLNHRHISEGKYSSLYTYGPNNQLLQQKDISHDSNQDTVTTNNYVYNNYGDLIATINITYENDKAVERFSLCSYEYDTYRNWTQKHCVSENSVTSFDWETIITRTIVYFDE